MEARVSANEGGEGMKIEHMELVRLAEEEGESVQVRPIPQEQVDVDLRSERITVRLSRDEVAALDAQCKAIGVGRSTFLRMAVRQALGLARTVL